MEPTNRLGITEEDWNTWKAAAEAWDAANPQRHEPHESCDCAGIPQLPGRSDRGHCAVRVQIIPWEPR